MTKRILYALCSAVLLALPWLGAPALTLLVAFVPLLILQQELADADAGQTVQVSGTGQDPKKEKGNNKKPGKTSKEACSLCRILRGNV